MVERILAAVEHTPAEAEHILVEVERIPAEAAHIPVAVERILVAVEHSLVEAVRIAAAAECILADLAVATLVAEPSEPERWLAVPQKYSVELSPEEELATQ